MVIIIRHKNIHSIIFFIKKRNIYSRVNKTNFSIKEWLIFIYIFLVRLTKPTPSHEPIVAAAPKKTHNRVLKHSASSDTDTMFTRNANVVAAASQPTSSGVKHERVELFSTDSEMDSFFKENENILNSPNNFLSSSSTTAGSKGGAEQRTDENTMNESFDEVEFDRLVSEANR